MKKEFLDIVDENDNVKGKASRKEIHTKGYIHRTVFFFIIDKKGRIFVNQRTADKEFYPEYWSNSFGGHINSGESYETAVLREAKEETGIKEKPIFIAPFKKRFDKEDRENVKVYSFVTDKVPKIDPAETKQGKFMTIKEAEELMKKEKFLPESKFLHKLIKDFLNQKVL